MSPDKYTAVLSEGVLDLWETTEHPALRKPELNTQRLSRGCDSRPIARRAKNPLFGQQGHAAGRQCPTCFSSGPLSGCVQQRCVQEWAGQVAPASIQQGLSPRQRKLRAAGQGGRAQPGLCRPVAVGSAGPWALGTGPPAKRLLEWAVWDGVQPATGPRGQQRCGWGQAARRLWGHQGWEHGEEGRPGSWGPWGGRKAWAGGLWHERRGVGATGAAEWEGRWQLWRHGELWGGKEGAWGL